MSGSGESLREWPGLFWLLPSPIQLLVVVVGLMILAVALYLWLSVVATQKRRNIEAARRWRPDPTPTGWEPVTTEPEAVNQ